VRSRSRRELRRRRPSLCGSFASVRLALAQDDDKVTVLTVSPLAVLFRIPAEHAMDAQFTLESRQILLLASVTQANSVEIRFTGLAARFERWTIAGQARAETAISLPPCGTARLSPDGSFLLCQGRPRSG